MSAAPGFAAARARMVRDQLEARGLHDPRVLAAMARVPREAFVPAELADEAYADEPLPIGDGQTISQPYVVARVAELARIAPTDRVLDIGAGSGYQSAVLACLAAQVFAREIRPELATAAAARLARLGFANVQLTVGDGGYGWPEAAPFDAITVAAAAASVPEPLLEQLADGGRLILPLGEPRQQVLVRITRHGAELRRETFDAVRYVAFVGDFGERFTAG